MPQPDCWVCVADLTGHALAAGAELDPPAVIPAGMCDRHRREVGAQAYGEAHQHRAPGVDPGPPGSRGRKVSSWYGPPAHIDGDHDTPGGDDGAR